jgi:hypothetical protein
LYEKYDHTLDQLPAEEKKLRRLVALYSDQAEVSGISRYLEKNSINKLIKDLASWEFKQKSIATVTREIIPQKDDIAHDMEMQEIVLTSYENEGLFIRCINPKEIDLLNNAYISPSDFKDFFLSKMSSDNTSFVPDELNWYSCTHLSQGVPVKLRAQKGLAVLFPASYTPFLYKHDMNITASNNVPHNISTRNYVIGPKDLIHNDNLRRRMTVMNAKRCGTLEDPTLKYYGLPYIKYDQIFVHYRLDEIIGIILLDAGVDTALRALDLRTRLGHPLRSFYKYSTAQGLTLLSNEHVIAQSFINSPDPLVEEAVAEFNNRALPIKCTAVKQKDSSVTIHLQIDKPEKLTNSQMEKLNVTIEKWQKKYSTSK